MVIPLAFVGITAGAGCVLLWPLLGPASLLLYPVFGSAGGLVAGMFLARIHHEPIKVDVTDDLVAALRQSLDRDVEKPASKSQQAGHRAG